MRKGRSFLFCVDFLFCIDFSLRLVSVVILFQPFYLKYIFRINEFARQACGEGIKAAQIRAQLFDVTFLMLCHIIQLYGIEVYYSIYCYSYIGV